MYTLIRKVTNAANRAEDTVFKKKVNLLVPPSVGTEILTGNKYFIIVNIAQNLDLKVVYVELSPDHSTFKGSKFDNAKQKMIAAGFEEILPDQLKTFKKKDI